MPDQVMHRAHRTEQTFVTSNLGLAAFLVAAQLLQLIEISVSTQRSGQAKFVFADPETRGSQLETEYLSNKARVSPNLFHLQLRELRRTIDARIEAQRGQIARSSSNLLHKATSHVSNEHRH